MIQHRHAEAAATFRHPAPDPPHPDNAECLAGQIRAEAIEETIPHAPRLIHGAHMLLRPSTGAQHQQQRDVGGRIRHRIRRNADHDATRIGCGDIDMVEPHAGRSDDLHAGRQARDGVRLDRDAQRDQHRVGLVGVGRLDQLFRADMLWRLDAIEQRLRSGPDRAWNRKRQNERAEFRHGSVP